MHVRAGIFVSDILDAVPIDKYFELFKPAAGGDGGFIRLKLDFARDSQSLPAGDLSGLGGPGPCSVCSNIWCAAAVCSSLVLGQHTCSNAWGQQSLGRRHHSSAPYPPLVGAACSHADAPLA